MPSELWLADTNILLRWVKTDNQDFPLVLQAIGLLLKSGVTICYTSQNLAEFWNVLTRPVRNNGYELSIAEADEFARYIEGRLQLLSDSPLSTRNGDASSSLTPSVACRCMMRGLWPPCRSMVCKRF